MTTRPERIVALGASNLTRGFPTVVAASRSAFGPDVEIFGALGLGRSYGMESRVLARTLPGILACGLWSALSARPPATTRALITDVGNDIVYGASPEQILEWVETALRRLSAVTGDIVVTGLPLDSIRCLSPARFIAFRTLFFPRCRLPFAEVSVAVERVHDGLAGLAVRYGARFVAHRPEWYGFDPVHIRPGRWSSAWEEILGAGVARAGAMETLRIHTLRPERQRLFGIELVRPQPGAHLAGGGRLWLF